MGIKEKPENELIRLRKRVKSLDDELRELGERWNKCPNCGVTLKKKLTEQAK